MNFNSLDSSTDMAISDESCFLSTIFVAMACLCDSTREIPARQKHTSSCFLGHYPWLAQSHNEETDANHPLRGSANDPSSRYSRAELVHSLLLLLLQRINRAPYLAR